MSFAGRWIELEIIMLREISQAQKTKCHKFSLICGSRSKILIIIIVMGYECIQGLPEGKCGRKERILKGAEDGSILCIYI
jgi:hypothetical protein